MSVYKITSEPNFYTIEFDTIPKSEEDLILQRYEHKISNLDDDISNFFKLQNFNNVQLEFLDKFDIQDYSNFLDRNGKIYDSIKDDINCMNLYPNYKEWKAAVKVRAKKEPKPKAEKKEPKPRAKKGNQTVVIENSNEVVKFD